jgi:hypothetical protein
MPYLVRSRRRRGGRSRARPVAEELHFGRAAARLHVSQPALSRSVQELERQLGVVLLARTNRNVRLTDAGRTLLEDAPRAFAELDRSLAETQRVGRGEVGRLRIGFLPSATKPLGGPAARVISGSARRGLRAVAPPDRAGDARRDRRTLPCRRLQSTRRAGGTPRSHPARPGRRRARGLDPRAVVPVAARSGRRFRPDSRRTVDALHRVEVGPPLGRAGQRLAAARRVARRAA